MIQQYHSARYPFLWAVTTEEERFIRENRHQIDDSVDFFSWDIVGGLKEMTKVDGMWKWGEREEINDPMKALSIIDSLPEDSVIFLKDYHRYFTEIPIIRQALNMKEHLKGSGKTAVFLSATNDIPLELKDDITVVDFEYPGRSALEKILKTLVEDNDMELPEDSEVIVDAMRGLTAEAAENALALSLVKKQKFDVRTVLDQKAAMLKASGVLRYGQFQETFENLHGLDIIKKFVLNTIDSPESRGILIYGVPGCGKSHFAKAVANVVQRALLEALFNNLRSKYQGQSEARLNDMLKTIEAFGRPIVFADEIDKAIAGSGSSDLDAGVGSRMLGELLRYWQDRKENGSYWICTCNSLDEMLHVSGGAMVRRFDAIFFVDMPTPQEAFGIARIWERLKGVKIDEGFNLTNYTGADIAKLATTMKMMECNAQEASRYVIPYGKANGKELEQIRDKAREVCIWASTQEKQASAKRKVKVVSKIHPSVSRKLN